MNPPAARVLVVDDDEMLRLLTRTALEGAGFVVAEAGDGDELEAAVAAFLPDIVLLDVIMPRMDGFAACAALRATALGRHVPVLMMTGLDDVESINRAYDSGATDFITKPIGFELLAHRLRYMERAKRTADELRASEARLALAQRIARLGHWEADEQGRFLHWTANNQEVLGLPPTPLLADLPMLAALLDGPARKQLVDGFYSAVGRGEPFSLEFELRNAEGHARDIHLIARPERIAEGSVRVQGTVQDVSERRRTEQRLHQLAFFDAVTGLPNRASLRAHLVQGLARALRGTHALAVLAIDLDHFQRINDSLGFAAGNEVLRAVGERFRQALRISDAVALSDAGGGHAVGRAAGDEFIVVLPEIGAAEDAAVVARRLQMALRKPFAIEGQEIFVRTSIGISVHPDDGASADELLKQANAALAQAKREGRDCYQFYTASLNARAFQRLTMEMQLQRALERQQFAVAFQPKLSSSDLRVTGFEALVRWNHPELGRVSPAEFIPIAEETGLIVPIGEYVLASAARQLADWDAAGLPPYRCAVNLSAAQFRTSGLDQRLRRLVVDSGVSAARIELELTESVLMHDGEQAIAILQRLKEQGFAIAIDDFGTGYSSLSYLKRLPIDVLKIDQSFVRDLATAEEDAAIVDTIVTMAHSLRLKVVAEGVETPVQLDFLRARGCDEVQGYLFSPPLPAEETRAWLAAREAGHR